MKKFLPFILLLLGVLVLVGVILFVKGRKTETADKDEKAPEVAFENRPIASLTPSQDGHWLKLKVEKIKIKAKTLDYELLYNLPDGRTQGVPGTVEIGSVSSIDRDLLLGSESSGKFRYDEGVKEGMLTLKFRNEKGKLSAKFATNFALLSETKELKSKDGKFSFTLDEDSDAFFVVMETFGAPDGYPSGIILGPYGIFDSSGFANTGIVSLGSGGISSYYSGKWTKLDSDKSQSLGIFVATSE